VISLGKRISLKILRKKQFSGVGRIVRALGADGPRVYDIYLISDFFGKSFRENVIPGGLSADPRRTVRYSYQNRVQLGGPGGRSADSSRLPGGRSAWPWRTVRPAQRSVPPAVDFAFLPLEFKRGQSARTSRTVREVRVLPITASNGKGVYILQARGWRGSLGTLKGPYSLVELSLSSLSLTWLSDCILCEIESF
jgi:hypothetical protein